MTAYVWPSAWVPRRFRLYVEPNERYFRGFYSGQGQSIDLLGERWQCELELPQSIDDATGAAREAFFDRLQGRANSITLTNIKRPVPRGTLRGAATFQASASQLASVILIQTTAGATLLAGDGIGFAGQVSRVMADATANGSGVMSVEILPRLRTAVAVGAAINWNAPTVDMKLKAGGGVPIDWTPGGVSSSVVLQLEEA